MKSRWSGCTAAIERRGGLCPRAVTHAAQQAIDADIFVQTLPVQAVAASADDASLALFVIRFQKPGEVCERDRKLATVSHPFLQTNAFSAENGKYPMREKNTCDYSLTYV